MTAVRATSPPPGDPASGEVRRRILRVTLGIVGKDGIAALSNRRIAREADVSLGTLTYHFPQQAGLLRESLLLYVGEEVERIESVARRLRTREPHPTPSEVSAEVQRAIAEGLDRSEPLAEMELHLRSARDPELRDASERCFAAYRDLATASLDALGVPDPARHARAVVAAMYGMGLQQLGSGQPDPGATIGALTTIVRGAFAEAKDERTARSSAAAGSDRSDASKGKSKRRGPSAGRS